MSMAKLKVGVIFGGRSGEHEVSLVSAKSVMDAMDKSKYEVVPVGISKKGEWFWGDQSLEMLKKGQTDQLHPATLDIAPTRREIILLNQPGKREKVDVFFPVLHGPYGEDGTIQGLFEMGDFPYVGSGVFGSAAAMDKIMAKTIWGRFGLPQVKYLAVSRKTWETNPKLVIDKIESEIGFPCFTKPANLGSSVGISKVKSTNELKKAIDEALTYDRRMVVEKGVEAREIECSVLGNDNPRASLCGEVHVGGEFYDFHDKYVDGKSTTEIPAKITEEQQKQIQEIAKMSFRALDLAGLARADFFLDKNNGRIYLNELNTMPGFTSISMYPKLWEASGLPYSQLIDQLIELALERHQDKSRNKIGFDSKSDWYK